jgi:hypothetical protein
MSCHVFKSNDKLDGEARLKTFLELRDQLKKKRSKGSIEIQL